MVWIFASQSEKVLTAKLRSLGCPCRSCDARTGAKPNLRERRHRKAGCQPLADALPDSTVIAVPGDRVQTRKAEILVNGQPVTLSDNQRQQFVTETDEIVPARHYVVVGERRDGPYSVVTLFGLIPAAKIVKKLN